MARAAEFTDKSGWLVFCPACRKGHKFRAGVWSFNGNLERPTFRASMLVKGVRYPSGGEFPTPDEHSRVMAGETLPMQPWVCHSFVTDGRIEYLGDCTHSLAGQTVDLPDLDNLGGST